MNILRRLGFFIILAAMLVAQVPAQTKSGAAPVVTAKLRFVTLDAIPPSLRMVIESTPKTTTPTPKTFSPIVPGLERLSPEYAYTGAPKFFLFDQAEGQTTPPKPVVEVTLPPAGGVFVVLLAKAQGDLWRAGVLDYGTQVFPAGSVRLINYSSVPLEAMVNEKRFSVKAGETGGHKLAFTNEKDPLMMKLTLAYQQKSGEWTVLNNTSQRFFPRQRVQLIGLNTPDGQGARVLQLVDNVSAPAPKPAPGSGR